MSAPSDAPRLIWHTTWEAPGESLYSSLLKLSLANAMGADELLKRVFGSGRILSDSLPVHKRSLLDTDWTYSFPPRSCPPYFTALCAESQAPASKLFRQLGTDEHVRYCPLCLQTGIHFPEFQIEAMPRCPIHDFPLLSCCRSCGQATSRYAMTAETFRSPYKCYVCGSYLGDRFDIDCLGSTLESSVLGGAELLGQLKKWLKTAAGLHWRWAAGDQWAMTELEPSSASERRKIFLTVTLAARPRLSVETVMACPEPFRWQLLHIGPRATISRRLGAERCPDAVAQMRIQVYKSIRRHIFKTFIHAHRGCACSPEGWGESGYLSGRNLPDPRVCLWIQAWMLWRSRFENCFPHAGFLSTQTPPCDWKTMYTIGLWDARKTEQEWMAMIWFSFHGAFRTVTAWLSNRWRLLIEGSTGLNSIEFKSVRHPYLPLFRIPEQATEAYTAVIEQSVESGSSDRYLIGADERARMAVLALSCNPLFPNA